MNKELQKFPSQLHIAPIGSFQKLISAKEVTGSQYSSIECPHPSVHCFFPSCWHAPHVQLDTHVMHVPLMQIPLSRQLHAMFVPHSSYNWPQRPEKSSHVLGVHVPMHVPLTHDFPDWQLQCMLAPQPSMNAPQYPT
jgi:hypothetical protein